MIFVMKPKKLPANCFYSITKMKFLISLISIIQNWIIPAILPTKKNICVTKSLSLCHYSYNISKIIGLFRIITWDRKRETKFYRTQVKKGTAILGNYSAIESFFNSRRPTRIFYFSVRRHIILEKTE